MVVYLQMMDSDDDISKFESIYHAYKDLLFNLAFEKLDNELDAEDVVHNVFLKIAENINRIEPVSARTKRLVITIFENLAVDTYRSNTLRQESADEQPLESAYEVELHEPRITACIMKLPKKQRDLIWLKHRGSAQLHLRTQLLRFLGTDEYNNVPLTSSPYYMNGNAFRIYESMEVRIEELGYIAWGTTITVASLIVEYIGEKVTNAKVQAICKVLNVALSVASLIEPGRLEKYRCSGMFYKTVTVNDSNYVYNITYRFIDYTGYNNTDDYTYAEIDPDSRVDECLDGPYYYDYYAQIEDAYDIYLEIGQMP